MNTKAQLKKFERSMDDLRSITRAFEHTATRRMAINKSEIEKIGRHLAEVKQTYVNTKISVAKGAKQPFDFSSTSLTAGAQGKQAAVVNLNVRKVSKAKIVLLITSEPAYYGNLMPKMISEFVSELGDGAAHALIIGKPGKIAGKLLEECLELARAKRRRDVAWEAADVLFFTLVYAASQGIGLEEILQELASRKNAGKKPLHSTTRA